jgi:hypothetical protein
LKGTGSDAPYLQFFVGRVDYKTESDITALMNKLTFLDIAVGEGKAGSSPISCASSARRFSMMRRCESYSKT